MMHIAQQPGHGAWDPARVLHRSVATARGPAGGRARVRARTCRDTAGPAVPDVTDGSANAPAELPAPRRTAAGLPTTHEAETFGTGFSEWPRHSSKNLHK